MPKLLLVVLMIGAARAYAVEPLLEGFVDELSIVVDTGQLAQEQHDAEVVIWETDVAREGADFMRFEIELQSRPVAGGTYRIQIRDANYRLLLELSQQELEVAGPFWTDVVVTDDVTIELRAKTTPTDLTFVVHNVGYRKDGAEPVPYTVILPDAMVDTRTIYTSDRPLYDRTRAVAKLTFAKEQRLYTCTGFMVSQNLLVTNNHCISTTEHCVSARAVFGYEIGANGLVKPAGQHKCEEVVETNDELDYSILRLSGMPGQTFGMLRFRASPPRDEETVVLVQHPAGRPKKIAIDDCRIVDIDVTGSTNDTTDFAHRCDTLKGSSGSPILDAEHFVVGLHHMGFDPLGPWKDRNRAVSVPELLMSSPTLAGLPP
jgi:V8-like Glu-specific endopeptidase